MADRLAGLAGGQVPEPYALGSLTAVAAAATPEQVRAALAASGWGDPGSADLPDALVPLEARWASWLSDAAPGMASWAAGAAALACGRLRGRDGSITEVPVLTMPAGDLTHPVPDLTGYITEGQIVLSAERHANGVYPPIDPLSSLSRLMRRGAGPDRTRDDHLDLAAQVLSLLARARDIAELADLLGADALSETERRYLSYADAFDTQLAQRLDETRGLDDTLDRAWQAVSVLPRRELTMLSTEQLDHRYIGGPGRVPSTTVDAPLEEPHAGPTAAR